MRYWGGVESPIIGNRMTFPGNTELMEINGIYNHQSYIMWMGASGNDVNGCVGKHCASTKHCLFLLWESWWFTSGSGVIFRQSHNFLVSQWKHSHQGLIGLSVLLFLRQHYPEKPSFPSGVIRPYQIYIVLIHTLGLPLPPIFDLRPLHFTDLTLQYPQQKWSMY